MPNSYPSWVHGLFFIIIVVVCACPCICVCVLVCVCILKSVCRLKCFQIFLLLSQNTKLNIFLAGIFLRHVFSHKYQNSHWEFIAVVTVVDGRITFSSVFVRHECSNSMTRLDSTAKYWCLYEKTYIIINLCRVSAWTKVLPGALTCTIAFWMSNAQISWTLDTMYCSCDYTELHTWGETGINPFPPTVKSGRSEAEQNQSPPPSKERKSS